MSDIAPVQPLPGFRFHPTDQELVIHYLYRKVHGLHDRHAFIPEDAYALCRVFKKNTVAPLIDLSSDADTYEDPMQSVPGGKDLMEHVSDGADSDKYPKRYVLGGIESDKYPMQSVLGGGGGTDNDPIWVESDVASVGKDLMQSVLCGVSTDKDHIQVESEFDAVHARKGKKQFLNDGSNKDKEGMQPVYAGADADEDNSGNAWYTAALAEEDNSWMHPPSYDDWYTRVDLDKDDSLMQFIFGDVMLFSAD